MTQQLRAAVARVVAEDNCSGCGACTTLSPALHMSMDRAGFVRPEWDEHAGVTDPGDTVFRRVCPGVSVTAPPRDGRREHETLGPYVSVWSGWATDPQIRLAGSSGGVITALSTWLLESGQAASVTAAAQAEDRRTRTRPVLVSTPERLLATAGSRYAPVALLGATDLPTADAVAVGKPCESDALRRLAGGSATAPLLISFFCAGVPSQWATDELVEALGVDVEKVDTLSYRGNGWPGRFAVSARDGLTASASYEQSWGSHLGPRLQNRCKICPDGTGGHADIAVGDFWVSDSDGYPLFDDGDGVSAVVARTPRGHEVLMRARDAGVLVLAAADMEAIAAVQPLQTLRRRTLWARLAGRRLGRRRTPVVRGYRMVRAAVREPRQSWSFLRGAYARTRNPG